MSWPSLHEIAASVQSSKSAAQELVKRSLSAIEEKSDYNAIITVNEAATSQAKEIDQRVKNGENVGPLAGVPYIAKDNYSTKGVETTAASNILKGYVPPFDATVIERLNKAGAIMVAKANLDAFAHGSSTENSDFGPTLNPHDKQRVAGGSSGGSAAAVALDLAPFALGSDTGGSIRLPAHYCGVVGLKPTYGLVSRYGVVAMASSTDVMGPLTKTVADAALVMDVISGKDANDSTTIERNPASYNDLEYDLNGKTVGVMKQYMSDALQPEIRSSVEAAAEQLAKRGATIKDIEIEHIDKALAVYYIIMPAEVSSNLSRYDGIRYGHRSESARDLSQTYQLSRSEGFNDEVKRRVMLGTYVLSSGYYDAYYKRAQQVRTILMNNYVKAFESVDFMLGPTSATTAFKIGENTSDPLQMYLNDIMTVSANLVGIPAISVPFGYDDNNLPIGVQLMAPQRHDRELLAVTAQLEAAS